MKSKKFAKAILIAFALIAVSPANAAIKNWIGGTDFWSVGAKWNGGTIPAANDTVKIAFGDGAARTITYNVNAPLQGFGLLSIDLTGPGSAATTLAIPGSNSLKANGIIVGGHSGAAVTNGRGALIQSNGAVSINAGVDLILGYGAGSSGAYTLSGGELVNSQWEYVGYAGTGDFTHSGGTNTILPSAVGGLSLAHSPGVTGTYNLSGTGALAANMPEYIGYAGAGVFNHSGGSNTLSGSAGVLSLGHIIDSAGTYNLSGTGILTVNVDEYIGENAVGVFTQSGGMHTVGSVAINHDLYVSYGSESTGSYSLTDGTLVVNGTEQLGYQRIGTFTQSGGTHTVKYLNLGGGDANGRGAYSLSGGTLNVKESENMSLNNAGNSFTQTGGAHTIGDPASRTSSLTMASFSPIAAASYSLTSGNLTVYGAEQIAGPGSASFTQTGGTHTIVSGPTSVALYLATSPGGSGTYSLSGSGVFSVTGTTYIGGTTIGPGGAGVMNFDGGAATLSGSMKVWNSVGTVVRLAGASLSVGSLDVDGNASHFNWTSGALNLTSSGLIIGSAGPLGTSLAIDSAKSLTVSGTTTIDPLRTLTLNGGSISTASLVNGGTFTYQSGSFYGRLVNQGLFNLAASFTASNGIQNDTSTIVASGQTLTANGAGFDNRGALLFNDPTAVLAGTTLTNTGVIRGEGLIRAPLHNNVGGELRAEPGKSISLTGVGNTNAGRINLLGGLIEFTQGLTNNASALVSGNGTLIAGNGLLNHGVMNFGGTANVLGDVTNSATGRIISTGGGATIFFDDVTNQGEIRTSTNGFTVFFGAVSGAGVFTGTGTVNFEGDLTPGNSPASVQFAGDVAFGSDAALQIELGGVEAGSQYDRLDVAGALAVGGTLEVSLINGFNPPAGNSFDILDWGSLSGVFASMSLPTLTGLQWDTSRLYTDGVLSVVSTYLAADFNENGAVNAVDLGLWKAGFGTSVNATHTQGDADGDHDADGNDFLTWQRQLGSGLPAGASNLSSIPEPSTMALLLLAGCGAVALPRPRRRRIVASLLPCAVLFWAVSSVSAQTLYVSANTRQILKVSASGSVSSFSNASSYFQGLAFDSGGNLYAADWDHNEIQKVSPTGIVTLFATLPVDSQPVDIAFDSSGNLYSANNSTGQISKITSAGTVTTFATLTGPGAIGLAFDSHGTLYAGDPFAGQIKKISSTGVVSPFVTLPNDCSPWGMTFDVSGDLYVADLNDRVRKISPDGIVTDFATFPYFTLPSDVAFGKDGVLYVVGTGSGEILKVTPQGVVSVFASGINEPAFLAFAPDSADFDENGVVDGADLTKWKAGFGTPVNATHMQGNADFDGDVDGADFIVWQQQFGSAPLAASGSATVPEPATSMLCILASVGIRRLGGRKCRKLVGE